MARRHRIESPSDAAAGMSAPNTRPLHTTVRGEPCSADSGTSSRSVWSSTSCATSSRPSPGDCLRKSETSRDAPAASVAVLVTSTSVRCVNLATWAMATACKLLAASLPRRWYHSQGVAARARDLAPVLGKDGELLEAAAWLHDIGYAPDLVDTGFHPLDGARYLRDHEQADPMLCRLVAHHSYALVEAEERGLRLDLATEFERPRNDLLEALTYCDMTTSPTGDQTTVNDRIAEILSRYGDEHVVSRFVRRIEPELLAATHRFKKRVTD
jgi:hypothetical protein